MGHVYISYAQEDADHVARIREELRRARCDVWMDDDPPGPGVSAWTIDVEKAIVEAVVMLAVLSPNARASQWVSREIGCALRAEVPIVPLLVEGNRWDAIPDELAEFTWIDAIGGYPAAFDELFETLGRYGIERAEEPLTESLNSSPPTPDPPSDAHKIDSIIRQLDALNARDPNWGKDFSMSVGHFCVLGTPQGIVAWGANPRRLGRELTGLEERELVRLGWLYDESMNAYRRDWVYIIAMHDVAHDLVDANAALSHPLRELAISIEPNL